MLMMNLTSFVKCSLHELMLMKYVSNTYALIRNTNI